MDDLKPCPFCGDTSTRIDEKDYWTGMKSVLLSVTIMHWCNKGEVDGAILRISGKTRDQAIARWNARPSLTPPMENE